MTPPSLALSLTRHNLTSVRPCSLLLLDSLLARYLNSAGGELDKTQVILDTRTLSESVKKLHFSQLCWATEEKKIIQGKREQKDPAILAWVGTHTQQAGCCFLRYQIFAIFITCPYYDLNTYLSQRSLHSRNHTKERERERACQVSHNKAVHANSAMEC